MKLEAVEGQYKLKEWSKELPNKQEEFVKTFLNTCYAPTIKGLSSHLLREINRVEDGEFMR